MKKIFSLLFGCLAAFIVSVSFSACGPKDQNIASSGDPLVGVWKWVYEDMNYTYLLTINNDNTGTLVVTSPNVSGVVAQAKFLWKYASKNIVQIVIESGEMPGLGSAGSKIDLEYEFYGSDKLVFTATKDPSKSFGPFTHSSDPNQPQNENPNQDPNQQQPQDRMDQVTDLVEGIGAIVNTQTMSDGSTVSTDNKGNKITIDPEGNTIVEAANGEKTTIDNSIHEDKNAPEDKWSDTRWISAGFSIMDPEWNRSGFIDRAENLGFQINGQEVSKDSTVEKEYEYESVYLDIYTTTAAITHILTKTHYTSNRTYYFTKYPIFTQTIYNGDTKYTMTIEERIYGGLYAVIYREEYVDEYIIDEYIIDKCPIDDDNAIYIYHHEQTQTHSENEQPLSKTTETEFYNYQRISDSQVTISNNTTSYSLIETQTEGLDFPILEAYTTGIEYPVFTFGLE